MDVSCVVRDIEDAIQLLVKTDCETNLKAITSLEDAAYTLWVESNTAFLDESMLSVYTEDEDNLMWDDEFDFESNPTCNNLSKEEFGQEDDLCSSIDTSITPCDQSFCSVGYLGDAESSILSADNDSTDMDKEHPEVVRNKRFITNKKKKTKIIDPCPQIHLTSEEVNTADASDDDWVIVDEIDQLCDKVSRTHMFPRPEQVPTCFKEPFSDKTVEEQEDWTILSLKITEINNVTAKQLNNDHILDTSRDSGLTSFSSWNTGNTTMEYPHYPTLRPCR